MQAKIASAESEAAKNEWEVLLLSRRSLPEPEPDPDRDPDLEPDHETDPEPERGAT